MRTSPVFKVLTIVSLIAILQIPILFIIFQNSEREQTREGARTEVAQSWGGAQDLIGPYIEVPFERLVEETTTIKSETVTTQRRSREVAISFPDHVEFNCKILNQHRYRGIFLIPLFKGECIWQGRFEGIFSDKFFSDQEKPLWHLSTLIFGIKDPHAISDNVALTINGQPSGLNPGTKSVAYPTGIHTPITLSSRGDAVTLELNLPFNGSSRLQFVPAGKLTKVSLTSDWPDPSFTGQWLADTHVVTESGFNAQWSIPYLGRSYPKEFKTDGSSKTYTIDDQLFGVNFYSLLDTYGLVERSIKYELLFLSLTFLLLWIYEQKTKIRIHPLQYLLVGAALVLFYLLLLALAEHMDFGYGYLISSLVMTTVIGGYNIYVLKNLNRSLIISFLILMLYGFLYLLLQIESFALLIGTLGLVFILALTMYFTRNIDWYDSEKG